MNIYPAPEATSHSHRICFVAPFGLRLKGTVRARILPLAQELAQRGHEVMLLIPPWDSPDDAGKRWEEGRVRIVNVSVKGGLLLTVGRMVADVRRFRPHILHIVKPRAHAGLIQWLIWHMPNLTRRSTVRIFLDVDDWEQAWEEAAGYSWPLARFLAWQEEWGLRHAHGITAASRWLEMRVNDYAPTTPVLYLPNGVAVNNAPIRPRQAAPGQPPTVLLFSRFVEVDPAWIGEFWTAMQQKVPNVRLIVAGQAIQPQHEAAMRIAIESATLPSTLSAPPKVRWLGYVDPPALSAAVDSADCAIFPAADVPLNQAKCSVRLATTLMTGLPVVASAVGEQIGYAGEGAAWLVDAEASPADFAQAVADLLLAPPDRIALAAQARRHLADRYDWEKLGELLNDFYA